MYLTRQSERNKFLVVVVVVVVVVDDVFMSL